MTGEDKVHAQCSGFMNMCEVVFYVHAKVATHLVKLVHLKNWSN